MKVVPSLLMNSYPAAKAIVDQMREAHVDESIIQSFERFAQSRQYGYVFEHNRPENMRLWGKRIVPGDFVNVLAPRGSSAKERDGAQTRVVWCVERVRDCAASIWREVGPDGERESREVPVSDLVAVTAFDQPVYPGLREVAHVLAGGDRRSHMAISGENYHVLQQLLFTHGGKVDVIYIDPPYNTGNRDWQYDDSWVGEDDTYRHSKWSVFMERRLRLARELLASDGCIFISIDNHEVAQLRLLCDQIFGERNFIDMCVWQKKSGSSDSNFFDSGCEYVLVYRKSGKLDGFAMVPKPDKQYNKVDENGRRYCLDAADRQSLTYHKSLDYPFEFDGETFYPGRDRGAWERRQSGEHTVNDWRWQWSYDELCRRRDADLIEAVTLRDGTRGLKYRRYRSPDGVFGRFSTLIDRYTNRKGNTELKSVFAGERVFAYPKPIELVMDLVGLYPKKDAVVLDFFAGSGTTYQAVCALNAADGGSRQCILVTNNEVSEREQRRLFAQGLRPGDDAWEAAGVARRVCFRRVACVTRGCDVDGVALEGSYPTRGRYEGAVTAADGLSENVRLFELTYEDSYRMRQGYLFRKVAPALWAKAGCVGEIIDRQDGEWAMTDRYGILFSYGGVNEFVAEARSRGIAHAFVVSDEAQTVDAVARRIPGIEVTQLYRGYLDTFKQYGEGYLD